MMTPGDVIGIPARQVIRCAPLNGVVDAEPNYLATIDFDAPDLPWLFSRKPASGPIQPWITLAVIDVTDLKTDPLSASPVGTQLTIAAAQLPNPAEAWMWAHGQLLDTDTVPGDPARSLSRLVSSRKLEQNRRYLACVVPVFAAGQDRRPRHRSGRRAHEHGFRVGSGRRRRHPAGLLLLAIRDWTKRRFRVAGPSAARRAAAAGPRQEEAAARLPDERPASAESRRGVARAAGRTACSRRERSTTIQPLVGASYLDALRSRLVDAGYDTSLLTAHPNAPPPAVGPPVYGQLAVGADRYGRQPADSRSSVGADHQSRSAAARRRGPGRRGRPAESGPLRRRSLAAGRRRARRERPPSTRRVLAGRQRDSPPEMDLADRGSRPRHLDGARSLARLRRSRTSRSPDGFVSRRCRRRSPRSNSGGSRARAAACLVRRRGVRRSVPRFWRRGRRRASVEGRRADRHDRRARRAQQGMGSSSGAVYSRAARPRSRPDGHDGGAGRDPARFDEPASRRSPSPQQTRPRRARMRSTPTACSPQWACGRSGTCSLA